MNAAALLHHLEAAGIALTVTDGDLAIHGDRQIIEAHIADIRAHKAELVALVAANDPADPPDTERYSTWLITLPNGERFSSMFCPPKSRAEVLALYPNADVEPEPEPSEPERLPSDVLAVAYAYLDHIGEHCPIERTGFIVGLERSAKQHPERLQWLYGEAVRMGLAVWEGAV